MLLKLAVKDFRNFKRFVIDFNKATTVIIGDNATGKTNLLEAIHMLSFGKSFKASVEEEMINYKKDIARVYGVISDDLPQAKASSRASKTKLEVVLTRGKIQIGEDPDKFEKTPRKKIMVNGVGKRLFNFAGILKTVLFAPDNLEIVLESPSVRRKFMDSVLTLVDTNYYRALLSYEKGLRQRNRLLFRIREDASAGSAQAASRSQLLFWDRLLIKNGDYITGMRKSFIDFANELPEVSDQEYKIEYDKSIISDLRLARYAREEVAAATTLVGPHRDDLIIRYNVGRKKTYRNLAKYGSRGEQRMGVLWLKMRELAHIKHITGIAPTLLLDDIFSELDHDHRDVVMDIIGDQQTIITTADPHFVKRSKDVDIVKLKA